jgi:transcriptional regulator with XRE-family HTH domain
VRRNPRLQFGRKVKELRISKQMTQEDLATRVGVFRTYLSRIETGLANPTLTMIYDLAAALGAPVTSLFEIPSAASNGSARAKSAPGTSRGRVSR